LAVPTRREARLTCALEQRNARVKRGEVVVSTRDGTSTRLLAATMTIAALLVTLMNL
jgi:hypothetical protein